jgi:hypothetical protein
MSDMKQDDKGERSFAGMTLEEAGERLKAFTKDFEWFLSNEESLRKKYPNKIIAVKRRKVIASSDDRSDVIAQLEERDIDGRTVLIRFVSKERIRYKLQNQ